MGAMKYLFMQYQERPEVQAQLELDDLFAHHCEPDLPETRELMTEPLEGTVFDPEAFIPF